MSHATPDFLHCYLFDGRGGGAEVDFGTVAGRPDQGGTLWLHLDVNDDLSRSFECHEVVQEVVKRKDHIRGILAQKPLGMNYAEAKKIVQLLFLGPFHSDFITI